MSAPYEFDEEQNKTIAKLGQSMQTVGLVMMIFGVIGIAGLVVAFWTHQTVSITFGSILESVLLTLFGYWTRNAGNAFDGVVRTHGNDVPLLMTALGDLGKMYGLVRNLILFLMSLFIAFFLVMVVIAPMIR